MADTDRQNYELAYHISSNLDDADVQKTRQELEKYVTSHGGVISFAKDPEKVRLAYPIKHQTNAFFGYVNFALEAGEAVQAIRDELRLNNNILRFLILKQEPQAKLDKEDVVRKIAAAEKRKLKAAKQATEKAQKSDEPKLDEKQIEEKLEEIIDKL